MLAEADASLDSVRIKQELLDDDEPMVDLDAWYKERKLWRPSPEQLLEAGDVMPPIGMIYETEVEDPEEPAWLVDEEVDDLGMVRKKNRDGYTRQLIERAIVV